MTVTAEKLVEKLDLTPEQKSGKTGLSDEQTQKIADETWPDYNVPAGETPKKGEPKVKEPLKKEEEPKKSEEPDPTKPEDDKSNEGKEGEEDPDKKEPTPEEAELQRLEAIAKEEGITIDQVKENEAKDKAIVERHANDPVKLARALRKEQSEYGKIKNELEELRDLKKQIDEQERLIDEKSLNEQIEAKRDQLILEYRKIHPEEEDVDDDIIFERGKAVIKQEWKGILEKKNAEIKTKADTKRDDLVTKLDTSYKEFAPEIRKYLAECPDSQVLHSKFDVSHIANMVRGKKYTPEYVKSLEDAAYKRGMEQPKVLGDKTRIPSSKTSSGRTSTSLSEAEKRRAKEMFAETNMTEEQMFKEYETKHKGKDF